MTNIWIRTSAIINLVGSEPKSSHLLMISSMLLICRVCRLESSVEILAFSSLKAWVTADEEGGMAVDDGVVVGNGAFCPLTSEVITEMTLITNTNYSLSKQNNTKLDIIDK